MADIFLRSTDGNDANAGTAKEAPKDTMQAAITAAGAGGRVFVSDLHDEIVTPAANFLWSIPGTVGAPTRIYCVPDWGAATGSTAPTAYSTGARFSVNGTVNNLNLQWPTAYFHFYGITFRGNNFGGNANGFSLGITTNGHGYLLFEDCDFVTRTGTGPLFGIGSSLNNGSAQTVHLINCRWNFNATAGQIQFSTANAIIEDCATNPFTGSIPTTAFQSVSGVGRIVIRNVDLSSVSGTLISFGSNDRPAPEILFEACKLHASATKYSTTNLNGPGGRSVKFLRCDSGDTNYKLIRVDQRGTFQDETTIVRSGGASDGTTPFAWKMVTVANVSNLYPMHGEPIPIWIDSTGSAKTITIEVVTDNVTLTDAEAWIEVTYLGTSGNPLGARVSDRIAGFLATPANQSTSSVTWTTTGLGTPVKQKLEATFTPQEKGPAIVTVHLGRASTTLYYCPKATVA